MRQANGYTCRLDSEECVTTGIFPQERHEPIPGGSHATSLLRNVL